jgi:hypothetical protein
MPLSDRLKTVGGSRARRVGLRLGLIGVVLASLGAAPSTAAAATYPHGSSLTQAYNLKIGVNYSYTTSSSKLTTVESIAITNNGDPFDSLNLDFVPRYLAPRAGYAYGITGITVDGAPASSSWTTITNLRVDLGKAIETGQSFAIEVRFWIQIGTSTDVWGSRMSKGNGMLAVGNWFPIVSTAHGTRAIGEWQVSYAATYDVDVTLKDSHYHSLGAHAVVASGDLVSRRTDEAGRTIGWVFHGENIRDFVLSVMPSYAYCSVSTGNEGGTVIVAQARSSTNCKNMLYYARHAFATYTKYYGEYPYATYTIAQAPTPYAWMEYPTLVFIGSQMITADGIWHETAHQWFYGILGNSQSTEPWIDEAWAYFSSHYFREASPISTLYGSTMDINSSTARFWEWDGHNQYGDVVYRRGARMIYRMRSKMGSTAFFAAVRQYIADHRFQVVSGADFFHYLNDAAGGGFCGFVSYC